MKKKFSSIWRGALALVLVLSFSLVMAVPAVADIIDAGGDGGAGAPALTSFAPQEVEVGTENTYVVTVEDTDLFVVATGASETLTDAVVITFPQTEEGYALWTGTTVVSAVLAGDVEDATTSVIEVIDAATEVTAIKVTIDVDIAAADIAIDGLTVTFTSTSNNTPDTYEWTVDMKDDGSVHSDTGTANVVVVTEILPPTILSVAGIAYQNSNDVVVITFSKQVKAADNVWSADEFTVLCGTTTLTLGNAAFDPAGASLATTMTITLNEATDEEYLVVGEVLSVTPVADAITDVLTNPVAADPVTVSVSGDAVVPTVDLTYDLDLPVKEAETLVITATFSEAMTDSPQPEIAIDTTDEDLSSVSFTTGDFGGTVFTYNYTVPAGSDGTATVTVTGFDLAGHAVGTHTDNTFEIDNTLPTIAVADIVGTSIEGADDTIVITFYEAVTAEDNTWSDDEFAILSGTRTLTLTNATFDPSGGTTPTETLTITLNEATNLAYLVNVETITVTPAGGGSEIFDAALNGMATDAIEGTTPVSGDGAVPTITNIVGADDDPDTIVITLSESVVPADGSWSSNEFALVENPNGAPVNITNATVGANDDPFTDAATILTITLDNSAAGDDAELDDTKAICVTPVTDAIVDLAGNSLADTEVSSEQATVPSIVSIVGTSKQGEGDTIVITFSEAVFPAEGTPVWSANELGIESPDTDTVTLTNAAFDIDGTNTVLIVTLLETEAYLVNGDLVLVTPAVNAIEDAEGNVAANSEVTSAEVVDGDLALPTIKSVVGWDGAGDDGADQDIIRIDFSEAVVPDVAWAAAGTQLAIENADISNATFDPASGITTTLTITLGTGEELTPGDTLEVTPAEDEITDLAGNYMSVDATGSGEVNQSYAIDLVAGYNLISLPLVESSATITAVLADLITADTVIQVRTWAYDEAGVIDEKIWTSGGPTELTTMTNGQGYWVEMNAADVLVVTGLELPAPPNAPPAYTVYAGWNMIGFKSLLQAEAQDYLGAAVWGTAEIMYGYDAALGIYTLIQADTSLDPGCGYWLAVSTQGTVYP